MRMLLASATSCLLLSSVVVSADQNAPACPGHPDALGTSRVLTVGDRGAPEFGLKTYPRTLALADHEVVLTFDDGPSAATTPMVLQALADQCVHATFFLIGRNAAALPALVKREIEDGHTVGHHSFSHPAITLRGLPDEAARRDIDRGFAADDKAAYGTAAEEPRVPFFRFPGFADTPGLDAWLTSRHVEIFGADLWASDWVKMTPAQELALLMGRIQAQGRGIILLHDVKAQTAAMLPDLLRSLKEQNFKVVQMVPGHGETATEPAPAGWRSETEATLAGLMLKRERRRHALSTGHAAQPVPAEISAPIPQNP